MFSYKYSRPTVAIDCVVFGWNETGLNVLLVKRNTEPFKGRWSLPGGFVMEEEATDKAASRVLKTKAGLTNIFFEQLYTFSNKERDPRGWVITVAYYALVGLNPQMQQNEGTEESKWFPVERIPALAFDHRTIFNTAMERLKGKVRYQPIGFELLPEKFTLTQLQQLYENMLGTSIDKRNFRKKILAMKLLRETGQKQQNVAHKAALLYAFEDKKYKELTAKGFHFEL